MIKADACRSKLRKGKGTLRKGNRDTQGSTVHRLFRCKRGDTSQEPLYEQSSSPSSACERLQPLRQRRYNVERRYYPRYLPLTFPFGSVGYSWVEIKSICTLFCWMNWTVSFNHPLWQVAGPPTDIFRYFQIPSLHRSIEGQRSSVPL